jgi:receptor protein-tyrosine kinase
VDQDPIPTLRNEPHAPLATEQPAGRRNRPDFPRQTIKQITLDIAGLDAAGLITPESRRTALVEQFRIIKRPVLMKASRSSDARVPNGNLVLVTSAIPGEGKTFTAINLAMSIAMELDHSVLLIDGDVSKSDVSHLLGIDETEGLMDFLEQPERALSEFLVRTDIDKLTVLPAGRPRANVTELLASEQMRQLVDEFGRRYTDRIVIIDSPPLLATSGAGVLSHLVGQTVFVVEAVRTPQSAIEEALGQLKVIRNVGLVLNKSRGKDSLGHQYGSYYAKGSDKG